MEIIRKSLTKCETKERAKCRKWRLRIVTKNGEQSRRFNGGTYTQAKEALARYVEEIADIPDEESTFADYAEKWVTYRENCGDYTKRTTVKNRTMIKVLKWQFGTEQINDITPQKIKDAYVNLRQGNSPSGKPLSGTYLHDAHKVLVMIMTEALRDGLISKNPCDNVSAPKIDTPEKRALTTEEVIALDEKLSDIGITAHTVAVRLALFGGLRRSEICGLQWRDYDSGFLSVSRACENDGTLKSTKTKASVREIPLGKPIQDALDNWYKVQSGLFAKLKLDHRDDTRIITDAQCSVMTPWNLGRWWNRNRNYLGADGITFHELRHTYLTMLVHSGANLDAARRIAGHEKLDVLMGIYSHRNRSIEREAVDNMMENLRRKCAN